MMNTDKGRWGIIERTEIEMKSQVGGSREIGEAIGKFICISGDSLPFALL